MATVEFLFQIPKPQAYPPNIKSTSLRMTARDGYIKAAKQAFDLDDVSRLDGQTLLISAAQFGLFYALYCQSCAGSFKARLLSADNENRCIDLRLKAYVPDPDPDKRQPVTS